MTVWQPKTLTPKTAKWNWVIIKFIMHPHATFLLWCVKMSSLKKAYGKLNQNLHLVVNIFIWMPKIFFEMLNFMCINRRISSLLKLTIVWLWRLQFLYGGYKLLWLWFKQDPCMQIKQSHMWVRVAMVSRLTHSSLEQKKMNHQLFW